jgi:hypothetical protein
MRTPDTERDDDLGPEEKAAFAALPRTQVPPSHLEDRIVDELHGRGLLVGSRGIRPVSRWLATAAAAAAVALFAGGVTVGQWLGGRTAAGVVSAVLEQDAAARALAVQTAGSEYVRAVARLSDLAETEGAGVLGPGREAAQVALHAAALELARLSPDDPTMRMVLAVLERSRGAGSEGRGPVRQTIWF